MQFYFGDEWRVDSNLTLNIGVRYQPLPRPAEVNGLNEFPYPCDCNNIGGQFGFAYRFPGSLGVVRGAYGLTTRTSCRRLFSKSASTRPAP